MDEPVDPKMPRPGETAAEFLKRRAGDAKPSDIHDILKKVPDAPAVPGDEIL